MVCVCGDTHSIAPGSGNQEIQSIYVVLEIKDFPWGVCAGAHSIVAGKALLSYGVCVYWCTQHEAGHRRLCVCGDTHSIAPGPGNQENPSIPVVLEIKDFLWGVCAGAHSIAAVCVLVWAWLAAWSAPRR